MTANGLVAPGWEPLREVFSQTLDSRQDIGAAVSLFHRGQCVIDLVGGYFDKEATKPYDHDTLQLVFSTTKGVTAIAVAICVERGLLSYEEPAALFWPEFAAAGKEHATVAQLLSHQVGLYTVDGPITLAEALDWNIITQRLAAAVPAFPIGSTHGYHALTFGWLAGELVRRVDGRNIGRFIEEEIANPLGVEIYVGLPEYLEPRVSPLNTGWPRVVGESARTADPAVKKKMEKILGPDTPGGKALSLNGAFSVAGGFNRRDVHAAEIPAANGISNARSLATMYAATMGEVHGAHGPVRLVSPEMMIKMSTTVTPRDEADVCLVIPTSFGMGFMTHNDFIPYSGPGTFGHPGAGGSVSFADPAREMSFSYVMNKMSEALVGDQRSAYLIAAAVRCADALA
ncbi:MAG: serine hydrolase domain-containing protein [Ilumatobacteraceae bacterium]